MGPAAVSCLTSDQLLDPFWPPAHFWTPTMATFGLFFPSVGSASVQHLFQQYIFGPSLPLHCLNFAKTANLPAMATFFGLIFSRLGRILAHLGPILDRLGHLLESILESIFATRTFLDPYNGHIWALFPVGQFHLCPICTLIACLCLRIVLTWRKQRICLLWQHLLDSFSRVLAASGPI